MAIGESEKKQILSLLQTPQWKAVEALINEMCTKIEGESTVHDSEWETIKHTLQNEGMLMGIRRFSQEIWAHAGKTK